MLHHIVGIHDVPARLRHFLAVFAENDSLIYQTMKRLRFRNVAEIEKHFVPETRVEEMKNGMFSSANIKIDSAGIVAAHPIFLRFLANEPLVILRIAKS